MITILLITLFLNQNADYVLKGIESSMKTGNSKELVKYFNTTVELKMDGSSSNYSKNQAEMVLKKFFQRNIPRGFFYIHNGSSNAGGLKYAIGQYSTDNGNYRMVLFLKSIKNAFVVDTLRITRDDSLESKQN